MPPMRMIHKKDPAEVLWEKLGKLDDISAFNNQVILAVYDRPEQTAKGIFVTERQRAEEKWQGKAHLLVKRGPTAFADPEGKWFVGEKIDIGDWLIIRPSDGFPISINGVECRVVNDTAIRMRVSHPDSVW